MVNEFSYIKSLSLTISAGGNLSAPVQLDGFGVVRVVMPSLWDTANLTFQTAGLSTGGDNWTDLYDSDGNEVIVQASAGREIVLPPRVFGTGFFRLRIRSGTSGIAVNQSVGRTLTLVVRPL